MYNKFVISKAALSKTDDIHGGLVNSLDEITKGLDRQRHADVPTFDDKFINDINNLILTAQHLKAQVLGEAPGFVIEAVKKIKSILRFSPHKFYGVKVEANEKNYRQIIIRYNSTHTNKIALEELKTAINDLGFNKYISFCYMC
jgi:hypothetical protein